MNADFLRFFSRVRIHCPLNWGLHPWSPALHNRLVIPTLLALLGLSVTLLASLPAYAKADLTPVDDADRIALEQSASQAFFKYLESVDANELADASDHALDPGTDELRIQLLDRLFAFMRGRAKNPVRNEALVIRTAGDWALAVYQYDTTISGKTARVITTAWMIQWNGYWRQFIVSPSDESFWDTRRSDYEKLQQWFDDHAEELVPAA